MEDPWAFGWDAIAALATAAAVGAAVAAWWVEKARERRRRAGLVAVWSEEHQRLEHPLEPGEMAPVNYLPVNDGNGTWWAARPAHQIVVENADTSAISEAYVVPKARVEYGLDEPWIVGRLPTGTKMWTSKDTDRYNWIEGYGAELHFRQDGIYWSTDTDGNVRRRYGVRIRNRIAVRRARRRRSRPSTRGGRR